MHVVYRGRADTRGYLAGCISVQTDTDRAIGVRNCVHDRLCHRLLQEQTNRKRLNPEPANARYGFAAPRFAPFDYEYETEAEKTTDGRGNCTTDRRNRRYSYSRVSAWHKTQTGSHRGAHPYSSLSGCQRRFRHYVGNIFNSKLNLAAKI